MFCVFVSPNQSVCVRVCFYVPFRGIKCLYINLFCLITLTTGHLIRDAVLVVDPSSTFFVQWAVLQRALHEDQLAADDDECDIYMLDYVDKFQASSVIESDIFCLCERAHE